MLIKTFISDHNCLVTWVNLNYDEIDHNKILLCRNILYWMEKKKMKWKVEYDSEVMCFDRCAS